MCLFFNDPATTEIYPLSLHDALPISAGARARRDGPGAGRLPRTPSDRGGARRAPRARQTPPRSLRSAEHTSELQSRPHLVCRLLLHEDETLTHLVSLSAMTVTAACPL